jgi:hypothetical protein
MNVGTGSEAAQFLFLEIHKLFFWYSAKIDPLPGQETGPVFQSVWTGGAEDK